MTICQLDECSNSSKITKECNNSGKAQVYRFPKLLKGKSDNEILKILLTKENPLITFDKEIVHENRPATPETNPGLIILKNAPSIPDTMNDKNALRILNKFKGHFPRWNEISWRNSIITITQEYIVIEHISEGKIIKDKYIKYDDPSFNSCLEEILNKNSQNNPTG